MLVIEAGFLWRRVAERFEKRVNKAIFDGYRTGGFSPLIIHSFLGLRVIMIQTFREKS